MAWFACDLPTYAELARLLAYDPDTGVFTRRVSTGRYPAKVIAGGFARDGYRQIRVDRRAISEHRMAWLFMTGAWPDRLIDHIDGDKTNNRIANLRLANRSQNAVNVKSPSPFCGTKSRSNGKWQAHIRLNGRYTCLGTFSTREAAAAAYREASLRLHGVFSPFFERSLA